MTFGIKRSDGCWVADFKSQRHVTINDINQAFRILMQIERLRHEYKIPFTYIVEEYND